jgi:hypothetical protein
MSSPLDIGYHRLLDLRWSGVKRISPEFTLRSSLNHRISPVATPQVVQEWPTPSDIGDSIFLSVPTSCLPSSPLPPPPLPRAGDFQFSRAVPSTYISRDMYTSLLATGERNGQRTSVQIADTSICNVSGSMQVCVCVRGNKSQMHVCNLDSLIMQITEPASSELGSTPPATLSPHIPP